MAGVVHPKRSGRKQWTSHDGPRCSLKRLRSQLASDGCPESQVVLAKQLLEEQCEFEVDKRENARLGVYWLIKASEQGNTEATKLLKACLESGKGITEQNYMDVNSCITMTQSEKVARKSAREMFASLSNGEEYITSEQLQRKMLAIDRNKKFRLFDEAIDEQINGKLVNNYEEHNSDSDEDIEWTRRSDSNEKLTEDHLLSAAVSYSHGQLPVVTRILCLSKPNLRALNHIPMIQRSMLHPFLALQIVYSKFIKFLSELSFYSVFPIFKPDFQLLFLTFIYFFISSKNIICFLPMVLYYITFFIMILTTFQILQTKREFYDFQVWSGIFIMYSGGSMNAEEAEFQYIRNNLKPCWQFFISLLINLMLYPGIVGQCTFQCELTVVAFCLTFMTLFGFMYRKKSKIIYDGLVLFSFAINILAKYPYETDPVVTQGWRFIDLRIPTFVSYIVGNGIEFCINFRLLLYTFIAVLFLKLSYRQKWRGTYMYFIPHCVTLSWLQTVIILSQGVTMFGLLRSTLALAGFVLFLPLVGLTTIFLPAAVLTRWMVSTNFIVTLSLFCTFVAIGFLAFFLLAKTVYQKYIVLFQVLFSVISFYFILNTLIENKFMITELSAQLNVKPLIYDQYQELCHQQVLEDENTAAIQIRCAQLEDLPIYWNGYVYDIKVTSISNTYKYFIDKLPSIFKQYLYCFYGEGIKNNCGLNQSCHFFYNTIQSYSECSLEQYNTYTFKIIVRMKSSIWGNSEDVVIEASNYFKNFTIGLNTNDHIWFKGVLMNAFVDGDNISLRPHITLEEIGCLACHNVELAVAKVVPHFINYNLQKLLKDFYMGIKFVVNVLFNPIIVFK